MTLAAATGCISGPMDRLRQCFEATPQWEPFTDGTDHEYFIFNLEDEPDDAEEFSVEEMNARRPFVFMAPDYPQGFTIVSDASEGSFRSGGVIQAYLETTAQRLGGTTQQEVARLWDNLIGDWLKELFYVGWNEQLLDIRRIDSVTLMTPETITQDGQGEFVKSAFKVHRGRDV